MVVKASDDALRLHRKLHGCAVMQGIEVTAHRAGAG